MSEDSVELESQGLTKKEEIEDMDFVRYEEHDDIDYKKHLKNFFKGEK